MKYSRGNTGTIRHVIKQAIIFLLLGAIVNVAVAWGFAWFTPRLDLENMRVRMADYEADGTSRYVWKKYFPSDMNQKSPLYLVSWTYDNIGLRYTTVVDDPLKRGSSPFLTLYLVRSGFPLNCLSYHYWIEYEEYLDVLKQYDARFALLWKQPSEITDDRVMALPLRPLWPGFVINTIFYAAIWFTLIVGWRANMRIIRRWQGHCPMCKYDLRDDFESGCSECGWNRTEY